MPPTLRRKPMSTRSKTAANTPSTLGSPNSGTSSNGTDNKVASPAESSISSVPLQQFVPTKAKGKGKGKAKAPAGKTAAFGKKSKAGRPSLLTSKVNLLLKKNDRKVFIRIAALPKHPQAKSPSKWPDDENQYKLLTLDDVPKSYEQLWEAIKLGVSEIPIEPPYEAIEKQTGAPVLFAHKNGTFSSTKDPPFLIERVKIPNKFFSITGDSSLEQAFLQCSTVFEREEDPVTEGEEDEVTVESDLSGRVPDTCDHLLLDLLVFVKQLKKAPVSTIVTTNESTASDTESTKAAYDKVTFEVMSPVTLDADDVPVSTITKLGEFTLTADAAAALYYGALRFQVATYARNQMLPGYVSQKQGQETPTLHFGRRSGLFLSVNFKTKVMERVNRSFELQEFLLKRSRTSGAIKKNPATGDRMLTIRVALARMRKTDQTFDFMADRRGASQEEEDVPPTQVARGRGRSGGSNTSSGIEAIVTRLYTDEASTFYHGFDSCHAVVLKSRLTNDAVAEEVQAMLAINNYPDFDLLWGHLLNDEHEDDLPKKGRFPPRHGSVIPPLRRNKRKKESLANELTSVLMPLLKDHDGKDDSKPGAIDYRRCFFRFTKKNQTADVQIRVNELPTPFTGKDVLAVAKGKPGVSGVFGFGPEEGGDLLKDSKASLYLEIVDGPKFTMDEFQKLKSSFLTCFFDGRIALDFKVFIEEHQTLAMGSFDALAGF